jgi:hypothetical protein
MKIDGEVNSLETMQPFEHKCYAGCVMLGLLFTNNAVRITVLPIILGLESRQYYWKHTFIALRFKTHYTQTHIKKIV